MSFETNFEKNHYENTQEIYLKYHLAKEGVSNSHVVQIALGFLGLFGVALTLALTFTLNSHHFSEFKQLLIEDKWKVIVGIAFGGVIGITGCYYGYKRKQEDEENIKIQLEPKLQVDTEKDYFSEYEYTRAQGQVKFDFPNLNATIRLTLLERLKKLQPDHDYSQLSNKELRNTLAHLHREANELLCPDVEDDLKHFLKVKYEELFKSKPWPEITVRGLRKALHFFGQKSGLEISPNYEKEITQFLREEITVFCQENSLKTRIDLNILNEQDLKEHLLDLYLEHGFALSRRNEAEVNQVLRLELRAACKKFKVDYNKFQAHTLKEFELKEKIFELYAKEKVQAPIEKKGEIAFWVILSLIIISVFFVALYGPAFEFLKEAVGLPGLVSFFTITSFLLFVYGLQGVYVRKKIIAQCEKKAEPIRPLAIAINLSIVALFVLSILAIRNHQSEFFDSSVLAGSAIIVGVATNAYCFARYQFSDQTEAQFKSFMMAFAIFQMITTLGILTLLGNLSLQQLGFGIMGVYLSFMGIGFVYHTFKEIKIVEPLKAWFKETFYPDEQAKIVTSGVKITLKDLTNSTKTRVFYEYN